MANGDFTSAVILNTQIKLETASTDPKLNNVLRTYSNPAHKTLKALLDNNVTGWTTPLEAKDKDNTVVVHWLEKTGVAANNCTTTCDWTGNEGGSYSEEYTLSCLKQDSFKYTSDTWRTSQYDEVEYRAVMFLQIMNKLIAAANTAAIAFLEANFGVNAYPESFTVNGSDETEVPAANLTPALWAHLSGVKEVNDMTNAFLVSGSALYTTEWLAMTDTDATGQQRINDTPIYFDLKGLSTDADMPTWLVDPASYAIANQSRYEATPVMDKLNRSFYSVQDPFGLGLTFDVIEKVACETDEEIATSVLVKLRLGFFAAPVSVVNTDNKGILKYVTV